MAQRLKMTDSDRRRRDRLFINHAAFIKVHSHMKPVPYHTFQHLCLHFAHQHHMDFFQVFPPDHMKLRILFLKLLHLAQHTGYLYIRRQKQLICQYRFQNGQRGIGLLSQPFSRMRRGQSGHCNNHTGFGFFQQLIFISGIQSDLIDLFRPGGITGTSLQSFLHLQDSACYL